MLSQRAKSAPKSKVLVVKKAKVSRTAAYAQRLKMPALVSDNSDSVEDSPRLGARHVAAVLLRAGSRFVMWRIAVLPLRLLLSRIMRVPLRLIPGPGPCSSHC